VFACVKCCLLSLYTHLQLYHILKRIRFQNEQLLPVPYDEVCVRVCVCACVRACVRVCLCEGLPVAFGHIPAIESHPRAYPVPE
jgi:hypothetical protein